MVLPGKNAKRIRKQMARIIIRYLDGDTPMCAEIEANKSMGKVQSYSKFASQVLSNHKEDQFKKSFEMPQTCYIYATKSSAFPGLVKIGMTQDVSKRLSQLNTACAPAPHVIVTVAPTFDKDRDEKAAHTHFSNARREGEFFEISEAEVKDYFSTNVTALYHIELAQHIASQQGLSM